MSGRTGGEGDIYVGCCGMFAERIFEGCCVFCAERRHVGKRKMDDDYREGGGALSGRKLEWFSQRGRRDR